MMSLQTKTAYTPEEYLTIEREAEFKSEYFNGEIFAMAGASRKHNLIAGNTFASLHRKLINKGCEAYMGDMRVKVSPTGLYTYPDIVIVCDTPQFEDSVFDTLINPLVIIEILSPGTESYDRGKKFENYRALPSLIEYIMISQNRNYIEHYIRQPDNTWLFSEIRDMADGIQIASAECELTLEEIYARVPE
ncbi:Uma2 family endonuclease [Desulfococcaceae bacterium HSG9]|nr:Uma2 family endonuclease [Desulfococcaceae bacterium HSG9]